MALPCQETPNGTALTHELPRNSLFILQTFGERLQLLCLLGPLLSWAHRSSMEGAGE